MGKHIIMVHGRNYKPAKAVLKRNWIDAIKSGIERDCDSQVLEKFKKTKKTMAYYGKLSNDFLTKHTGDIWTPADEKADIADRNNALTALKAYKTDQFDKKNYDKIRDWTDVVKEATAGLISGPSSVLRIGDNIVGWVAPDMANYWNPDAEFGSEVRWELTEILVRAITAGDDILLISHSLGTIVSYDVLWKLSHYGEYGKLRKKGNKVNTLITIGSPLGDANVKKQLKGAAVAIDNVRRYPKYIQHWINFAAEDDYISHDPTLGDEFKEMKKLKLIDDIIDNKKIYNMSIRDGNSNPHHSTGYLIHPDLVSAVATWL